MVATAALARAVVPLFVFYTGRRQIAPFKRVKTERVAHLQRNSV
jgi:hypothetical protein